MAWREREEFDDAKRRTFIRNKSQPRDGVGCHLVTLTVIARYEPFDEGCVDGCTRRKTPLMKIS